jgi:putative transposase
MSQKNPFKYYKTSPEIIKLAVMYYIRYPLSLRQVEDILHERGIDICHETVRYWWDKFGILFAKDLKKKAFHPHSNWRWHIDEVFVKINGETHYLWRAIDHEGTVLECYVSKRRDKKAALKMLKNLLKRYGNPQEIVTDKCPSYGAALKDLNLDHVQITGRSLNGAFGELFDLV